MMILKNIMVTTKTCLCCKAVKSLEFFWKRKRTKDGYNSSCIDCVRIQNQKSYKNHWAKNRKRLDASTYKITEALREKCNTIKHERGCYFCLENDPVCLEFHHIIQTDKKWGISNMICTHKSWETIQLEIKKCIVTCANCHRKIHAGILFIPENVISVP